MIVGESEGYTVKSKEKDFTISDYPLLQTEFMYGSKTGKADKCMALSFWTIGFNLDLTNLFKKEID